MPSAIEVVRDQLNGATSFADIFGILPKGDSKTRLQELRSQYALLARVVHPDHAGQSEQQLATDVFSSLGALYKDAIDAVNANRYEEPLLRTTSGSGSSRITLTSTTDQYLIGADPWTEGDFSNVHLGTASNGSAVIVKVAAHPTMNQYLVHEAVILKKANQEGSLTRLQSFLPQLIDSFLLREAGGEEYRVNVFNSRSGYLSLTKIRDAFPSGLDPRDAAWIMRRVLGQTLAANMMGVVHGAIVPDHVLVHPTTHEPLHIGWAHCVSEPKKGGTRITTIVDRFRAWYPREVFAREAPSHQTDIYMAGKTMVYLLGGDVARNTIPSHVPPALVRLIRSCLAEDPARRPRDGLSLLRSFTETIRTLWGRSYRPLTLPK